MKSKYEIGALCLTIPSLMGIVISVIMLLPPYPLYDTPKDSIIYIAFVAFCFVGPVTSLICFVLFWLKSEEIRFFIKLITFILNMVWIMYVILYNMPAIGMQ